MPEMRLGVRLTPKKAQFFDLIAGCPGIGMEELRKRMGLKDQRTVAVYATQLNEYLEPTGWKVRGWRGWGYRFERINQSVDNPHEIVYRPRLPKLRGRPPHAKSAALPPAPAGVPVRA